MIWKTPNSVCTDIGKQIDKLFKRDDEMFSLNKTLDASMMSSIGNTQPNSPIGNDDEINLNKKNVKKQKSVFSKLKSVLSLKSLID